MKVDLFSQECYIWGLAQDESALEVTRAKDRLGCSSELEKSIAVNEGRNVAVLMSGGLGISAGRASAQ